MLGGFLWWKMVQVWWKPVCAVIVLLAVVGAVVYLQYAAVQKERMRVAAQNAIRYERTIEAINETIQAARDLTPDAARAWLRSFGG